MTIVKQQPAKGPKYNSQKDVYIRILITATADNQKKKTKKENHLQFNNIVKCIESILIKTLHK